MPGDLYPPRRLREGLWGPIAPPLPRKPLCGGCWEEGVPAPWRCLICADAQTWRPRNRDISQQALAWLMLPSSAQSDFSLWLLEDRQLRSQSSGGSCNFGSNCCVLCPSPGHSAWFAAYNLLLGRPLRLAGLGSPGVPSNSPQAFLLLSPWPGHWSPALFLLPGPDPRLPMWGVLRAASESFRARLVQLFQPGSVSGAGLPQGPDVCMPSRHLFGSVLLLLSTSRSSHVARVLPSGGCWWGQLALCCESRGTLDAPLGLEGAGLPAPTPALRELCLLQLHFQRCICTQTQSCWQVRRGRVTSPSFFSGPAFWWLTTGPSLL